MRTRSLVGPIFLILIGALFLAHNVLPEIPLLRMVAIYWPFVLIAWGLIRLAEVAIGYTRTGALPRASFSGGEIVLIVFTCVIGSAMYAAHRYGPGLSVGVGAGTVDLFGEQFDYPVSIDRESPGIKTIVFEYPRGNVRVTGADGTAIRITGKKTVRAFTREDADEIERGLPFQIDAEGDRLIARMRQPGTRGRGVSLDLEVSAPRGVVIQTRGGRGDLEFTDVAGVEVSGPSSDVRLTRIAGDVKLDLARGGDIHASGIGGSVELEGRGDDVELENIAGQVTIRGSYAGELVFRNLAKPLRFESRQTTLHAEGVPGEISMDLGQFTAKNVTGPFRLNSRSRDIRMEGFTESLELETERGDIDLDPGKQPLPRIEARSRSGNIEISLPGNAKFEIEAAAERGETHNEFGPAITTQGGSRNSSLRGGVGGGPMIRLNTDRGSITVRRTGALAEGRF
jgi:Putative adhesin